eukprot:TRINITY_DN11340_c0_g1_i1.p1 TRINITY_DN11340_c0_g1~~TRINITY_DN11340_c0_g1_i1.p1  ORF type:complete len:292 (-),score=40.25 TRINITY_DN11340_c0_g1_i1:13-888(-)
MYSKEDCVLLEQDPEFQHQKRQIVGEYQFDDDTYNYNIATGIYNHYDYDTFQPHLLSWFHSKGYGYPNEEMAKYIMTHQENCKELIRRIKEVIEHFYLHPKASDNAGVDRKATYSHWHLMFIFCLYGPEDIDFAIEMLHEIACKRYYSDAQELFVFGFAQFEHEMFCKHLKKIILIWDKRMSWSGTGLSYNMELLLQVYWKVGVYDIFLDEEVLKVLDGHEIVWKKGGAKIASRIAANTWLLVAHHLNLLNTDLISFIEQLIIDTPIIEQWDRAISSLLEYDSSGLNNGQK